MRGALRFVLQVSGEKVSGPMEGSNISNNKSI